MGHIPLRDDSLVTCAEILAYYRGIAAMLREVPHRLPPPDAGVVSAADVTKHYGRLRDAWAYGSAPAMQVKLVLVGEPMAGKTSLLRALRSRRSDPTAPGDRTVGIDVRTWRPHDPLVDGSVVGALRVRRVLGNDEYEVEPVDGGDGGGAAAAAAARVVHRDQLLFTGGEGGGPDAALLVHAFDMGGQEAFRATQQVHLAGDALYLLCVRGAPVPAGGDGTSGDAPATARAVDESAIETRAVSDGGGGGGGGGAAAGTKLTTAEGAFEAAAVDEVMLWLHALCARASDASALNVKVVVTCGDAMSAAARASLPAAIARGVKGAASIGIACGPRDASDVHVVSSLAGLHGVDALRDSILGCVRDTSRFPRVYAEVPRFYLRLHAVARRLHRGGGTVLHAHELLAETALRVAGGQRACRADAACTATGCSERRFAEAAAHSHWHCGACGGCIGASCLVPARARSVPESQWVSDSSSAACTACAAAFTWRRRRHHCRCCGALVCDKCSSQRVAWGGGGRERVCNACAVCPQCGANDPSQRALEYLHDVGALLYFGGGGGGKLKGTAARVDEDPFVVLSPQVRRGCDVAVLLCHKYTYIVFVCRAFYYIGRC